MGTLARMIYPSRTLHHHKENLNEILIFSKEDKKKKDREIIP